ncbi:DUF4430 domain-containing protein [Arcobacter sp. CECT 8985]|uniref:DUF4430 domain-containing protein n=1 Tax=Arcobacter sp. CECT 8985 TaxID=1935424 RepID=UPI00100B749D|nr:DUF4430 domain-containing protein [Arcobacter sp. CECT 8985]RXJ88085.1 hypothetical protein CRU93_00370 [Arcobacter sp. CECT 8985]
MSVSISITGGSSVKVNWTNGMNAQQALELAEESLKEEFIYSLEYYGKSLGYLVNMINETYDTFKSTSTPYFYWEFLVNERPSPTGIDNTILNDGDKITFSFKTYDTSCVSDQIMAKHNRRTV